MPGSAINIKANAQEVINLKRKIDELSSALVSMQRSANPALYDKLNGQLQKTTIQYNALRSEVNRYSKEQERASRSTSQTSDGLVDLLKKGAALAGITYGVDKIKQLGSEIISVRGEIQQLQIAFETMLGSKEKADRMMADIKKLALSTPFTLTEVADNTKQIIAMGIESDKAIDTVKMLGDVAAGVSVPLWRVAINYGQVSALGKLQSREIRDFAMAGIPIVEELGKMLGKTSSEIYSMVEAGRIGFPEVEQAFKNMSGEGGKFYNLMEKQNASVTGQISKLKDSIQLMFNEIGQDSEGVIYTSINAVSSLVDNYETLGKVLLGLIATYGVHRAAMITNAAITEMVAASNGIFNKSLALRWLWTERVQKAQAFLDKTMLASPYAWAAAAAIALGYGIYKLATYQTEAEEAQNRLNESMLESGKASVTETRELVKLKGELSAAKKGSEEYKKIKDQIVSKYGQYYQGLEGEIDRVGLLDSTYKKLTESIMKSFGARQYDKFIKQESDRLDTVINENLTKIQDRIYSKFDDKEAAAKYFARIRSAIIEGRALDKSSISILDYVQDKGTVKADSRLDDYIKKIREAQKITEDIDKKAKERFGVDGSSNKATENTTKSIKSLSDQTEDARKKVSDLKKELEDLQSGKVVKESQSKAIEEKVKEIKDAEDSLSYLVSGKSASSQSKENKAGESATEKAKKLQQELNALQSKLSNEQIRQQIESDQKLIDRQEDGFNKQFEQNKLNYKKELQQIKEFEDEKTKERAEAILKFGKDKVPENLSESNVKNQVDAMKNNALLSFEKANKDTLKNLTDKYQSYADQRLEIEKKFNKDIEALQSQLPENMLADLKSKMLDLFGNGIGNVDLLARPMIDAAELVKKGWEDAGDGIATVFSSQFGISDSKGKEHEILVTPILPNGDVLSPDDLSNYVDNILSGSEDILKADNLGIVIGIDVNKDGSTGETLHQLQEQMVNIKKDAPEVEEKIRKLIAKATTDKGKGLLTFDFERMKEAPEYIRAFEDLGTTSSETLNSLLGQFEKYKEEAAKVLSPKELREYTTTIQSISDELSNRDLYGSLIKQKDEAVKANQRLIKAENDLRLVQLGIGDPSLTEEEAIKRVNKAKDEYYNKNKKVLDTQKKIRDQVSALAKEMSGLGNALGGTSGEIISFIGDITSFYTTASEGIEKVAQTGAQAISVVEKASVILTIISTAIQLMKQLNSILPDAFSQYEKYDEKIERINDMRDAVNEYEIAVLKANQAENSWFGNDSLRNLKDYKELQTKIFDSYRDKMLEEQAIYENKGSGGWLTNTFKSAVSWVSKITYGFDILNKKYKEGTTAAVNNLRIETRKRSSGFLGSGIGGKSQKTEDLQTWINNNKDLFKKGLDTQLFGADGMLNQELAGVILEKYGDKLVGQTKETLEELKTLTEQYNEFRAQLREYVNSLYEPLVDNMVSSIWDWFDEGKNALDSFKDYAKETFRDIVSDMIKTILLKDVFKDFQDSIAKLYEEYSKGNLTEAQLSEAVAKETNAVMDRYNTQLPTIQGMVDSINQNIKDATGIDLKNTDKSKGSSQTPSSGYSVSMSQDTGDKLVGIQTGSQMRLISLDQNVARIAQWNQPVSEKFNFDTIAMPLGALSQSSLRIERMMEENRNIQMQMFYKVSDIEKWSRVLPQMNEVLGQMNGKLDNI